VTALDIVCAQVLAAPARRALEAGVPPHRLLGADAPLEDADVAFGQPDAGRAASASRLSWVHLSTAGYTAYDRPAFRDAFLGRGAALTTSSSVFSEPCAQHVLAFLLADARQLPRALGHQLGDRAWASAATRAASYLLRAQTVVLVGFGAIARRLVQLLSPFGLTVVAVRRTPRGDEPVPTYPLADVDARLARAHHVVNTLPASDDTRRFFGAERLSRVARGAVFYNIGRGATVDHAALERALAAGPLRAAYLDVTDPEPLPPEHALWSAPGCVITPHAAGGHADEEERVVAHFLDNLRRRDAGLPLLDRII
jgi:phosphoglycerate dehydrogenase-like enzyme